MKILFAILFLTISLLACNSDTEKTLDSSTIKITPLTPTPTPTPAPIPTSTPTPAPNPTSTPTPTSTSTSTMIPQADYPTAECVDGTKSYNLNPWDGTTCKKMVAFPLI